MAFMTETAKYETKNVENMIRGSRNITFLNIFSVGKEILRIEAETYYVEDVLENGDVINIIGKFIANSDPCAKLNIVCKDERKRRPETLRKVGVTLEELRNGMEKKEMARAVSDYFIKYDGIIVSCKPYSIISMLNNNIIESKYKSIDNSYFDIKRMAKKCGENFTDKNSLENLKETFIDCTGSYRRMKKMEQNKKACVVNYAYFWQSSYRNYAEWIFCDTSIGKIYYDTLTEKWGITKKEEKENGLRIESVDTFDVKKQLMLKAAFNRGEICWAAPFGHIVWVDENGIPYDISGVNESETDDYIPEYMMGNTILDFKHIAGKVHNTSDQEIAEMVLDWQDIRSNQFGGDVTKIKTKKDAEKYLQQAFPVLWLEDQEVYEKKVEYLKKKFGLQDLRAA